MDPKNQFGKSGESAAVIDMEMVEGGESDMQDFGDFPQQQFEQTDSTSYYDDDGATRKRPETKEKDDFQTSMVRNVTSQMWQSGRQKAKQAFSVYANIDILRPYFDVQPHEVRTRLIQSLIPKISAAQQKVPRELYGPTMLVFTLIALLLFQMKSSDHAVQEGTLMGSAFGVCFGYWLGVSSLVWFLAYVSNVQISLTQVLSLLGYALFGHCIVLFLVTLFHSSHHHGMFYLMWAFFGGLSTLKMISVLSSRTLGQTQKLVICGTVTFFHMCFLLYLHFAYHKIVADISAVLDGPVMPKIQAAGDKAVADAMGRNLVGNDRPASAAILNKTPLPVPENLLRNRSNSAFEKQPIGGAAENLKLGGNVGPLVENNVADKQVVPPDELAEKRDQIESENAPKNLNRKESQILNALAAPADET